MTARRCPTRWFGRPRLGALAFVGGRSNGGRVAAQLVDTGKRHLLEQEGLNTWGIWNYSDWDALAAHLKKGYEYGKQRCTAYPRFVIQRDLVDSVPGRVSADGQFAEGRPPARGRR